MTLARDVTVTKVDHEGRPLISYPGRIVYRAHDAGRDGDWMVARCNWTHDTTYDLGPFLLEPGDIFVEFYYLDQPFNVFAIYDRVGRFKGWYCNVTAALEVTESEIRWRDLALDLLVLPDGRQLVLDEDEFAALDPSPALQARAEDALSTLRRWIDERRAPFVQHLFSSQA